MVYTGTGTTYEYRGFPFKKGVRNTAQGSCKRIWKRVNLHRVSVQEEEPSQGFCPGRGVSSRFLSRKRSLLNVSILEEESTQGFCPGRGVYSMFQSWKRSLLKVSVLVEESAQGFYPRRGV